MLDKVQSRLSIHGISTRQLARDLEISPSLLSMVLTGQRKASKQIRNKLDHWLTIPLSTNVLTPAATYRRFIAEKQAQLAPLTIKFYQAKLRPFVLWCEQYPVPDVRDTSRTHIAEFVAQIRQGRRVLSSGIKPLSHGALKLHHQTIKTFFNYVGETCDVPIGWKNPVDGIKVKGSQAQTLEYSDDQIRCMFETMDNHADELIRLRNRAILTVLLNSAVRASELVAMNVADIGTEGRIKVVGKGSKQRVVTVGTSGLDSINDYLKYRGYNGGPLWQTILGGRLTSDGLRGLLDRIEAKHPEVFTDGLYAHRFRHTAITRLLRARVPLRSVQRYAGHSNPQTTLRYAQAIEADEAFDAIHKHAIW